LQYAYLQRADLHGANLHGANLHGADLHGADLQYADLQYADLQYAYLHGADFDFKYFFLSIYPIGSENGCLWVVRDQETGILKYNRGCFSGTEEEFRAAVIKKHAGTEYEKKYLAALEFIKIQTGG
jgi:hypothetical protein